jgi:hypothetical protein
MVATLRKSLKTIEDYKTTNPHYTDLLEIVGEILNLYFHRPRKLNQSKNGGWPSAHRFYRQQI